MLNPKAVGRNAAARKYDLLTAMGAFALSQEKAKQRLVLRILTLITARYNWARDELTVGQREIARLWAVDERTVKREMAKLRGLGWLVVKRQGARGRVTEYSLSIETVLTDTRGQWAAVGPDFEARMQGTPEQDNKVVPLHVAGSVPSPDVSDGNEWALAQAILHAKNPLQYGSWFHNLVRTERAGGRLTLTAPSRFHASYVETNLKRLILSVCQSADDSVSEVVVLSQDNQRAE